MKNIQTIDGAANCAYGIWAVSDRDFALLFPRSTDVAFPDEIEKRLGATRARNVFTKIWERPVDKKVARGIHGTIFYGLDFKKRTDALLTKSSLLDSSRTRTLTSVFAT